MNHLMPPRIASQVTRLPLTKFSHTTTTINHSVPLCWTHVNGDGNLACILEQIPGEHSVPPRLVMRVARNDGILVFTSAFHLQSNIQITDIETGCQSGASRSSTLCSHVSSSEPKCPRCMAVKAAICRCGQVALSCSEVPSKQYACMSIHIRISESAGYSTDSVLTFE